MVEREEVDEPGVIFRPHSPDDGREIRIGRETIEVRLTDIKVLEQMRHDFDPGELEDLRRKMLRTDREDGYIIIDLIHVPTVAIEDDVHFKEYLLDHGLYYGIEHDVNDYTPSDLGVYPVLVAGERRDRTIYAVLHDFKVDPHRVILRVTPRENISFDEALQIQGAENTSSHLKPAEDAAAIEKYYKYIINKHDRTPTNVEIANHFGFSEKKVADALTFQRLPEQFRKEVDDEFLTYSTVVSLASLLDAYRIYRPIKYPDRYEGVSDHVLTHDSVMSVLSEINMLKTEQMKGLSAAKRKAILDARKEEILSSTVYQNGELFQWAEADAPPADSFKTTGRRMGLYALRIAYGRLTGGYASKEELEYLRNIREELSRYDMGEESASEDQDGLF